MFIVKIISIVIILAASSLSIKYFMHMFQLNSYATVTQLRWYEKNAVKLIPSIIILMVAELMSVFMHNFKSAPLFFKNEIDILVLAVLACICSLIYIERHTKKKLVYTKRVIRIHITTYLLIAILLIWALCVKDSGDAGLLVGCAYGFVPFIIILANIINIPIEKAVNNYYIRDAKKILEAHDDLVIVGITGSYGKTSVKYYLNTLLKAKYNVLMTPESYNTPMGVVKTIRQSLKSYHEIFVCEMGAKKLGEIKEICDIVHPTHGILTSIGPQHLETFKSLDNVKKTKFELADALPQDGLLLVNGNDTNISDYGYEREKITYGITEDCEYFAYDIDVNSKGTSFKVRVGDESCDYKTELVGKHNVINIVGAIAMCHKLGISLKALKPQVKKLEGVPHRLQLIAKNGITIIDDAYNSNPSGAKAALDTLALFDGTKILITPGMVELGSVEDEKNYEFGRQAAQVCDYIYLVGVNKTKPIYDGIISAGFAASNVNAFDNLTDALNDMYALEEANKIVLLENDLPDNY